jgi:hypothetical protein
MTMHLTRSEKILSAVHPTRWMGLIICCGMTVKRVGMIATSVRKMRALTVKTDITNNEA